MQLYAEQTALFDGKHVRDASDGCVAQNAVLDIAKTALAFADEHVAARQESHGPGVFEASRHRDDAEIGLLGLVDRLLGKDR